MQKRIPDRLARRRNINPILAAQRTLQRRRFTVCSFVQRRWRGCRLPQNHVRILALQQLPDPTWQKWRRHIIQAGGVGNCVRQGRRRDHRAAIAKALGPMRGARARGVDVRDLEMRQLRGGRAR